METVFLTPFAATGDKTAIPVAVQTDGSVSCEQGFGYDYARDQATDPLAKHIPRNETNWLYWAITNAIRELQVAGLPDYITAAQNGGTAYPYAINAMVRYEAPAGTIKAYRSLVAVNTALPTDATKWADIAAESTTTLVGLVRLATQGEAAAGLLETVAVTPNGMAAAMDQMRLPGQCRLVLSGGNLVLQPYNGNRLSIAGTARAIPAAGISLAPAGTVAGTLYYIYAAWVGGAVVLEASTTGHATDAATGVEIKTGDASRTLVGMAVPAAGPAWATDQVASWFGRRQRRARAEYSGSTSSTTMVTIPGSTLQPLVWAGTSLVALDTCNIGSSASGTFTGYSALSVAAVDYLLSGASLLASGTQGAVSGAVTVTPAADGVIPVMARGRVNSGTLNFGGFFDLVWEA